MLVLLIWLDIDNKREHKVKSEYYSLLQSKYWCCQHEIRNKSRQILRNTSTKSLLDFRIETICQDDLSILINTLHENYYPSQLKKYKIIFLEENWWSITTRILWVKKKKIRMWNSCLSRQLQRSWFLFNHINVLLRESISITSCGGHDMIIPASDTKYNETDYGEQEHSESFDLPET